VPNLDETLEMYGTSNSGRDSGCEDGRGWGCEEGRRGDDDAGTEAAVVEVRLDS